MLKCPDDAVHDQLLVLWGDLEKGAEAVCVDRFQEAEELQPVFREILQEQKNKKNGTSRTSGVIDTRAVDDVTIGRTLDTRYAYRATTRDCDFPLEGKQRNSSGKT